MFSAVGLFFGAFLDALIGSNLFVPGEPFLLAAGYQWYQGTPLAVIWVLLGGFFGDQLSYWIGRISGRRVQSKLIRWQPGVRRPIARCRKLMRDKGHAVLMVARLLGPVAWVVPFIAGTQQMRWRRFSLFATVGLILGVGQFVLWGYALAAGLPLLPYSDSVIRYLQTHSGWFSGAAGLSLVIGYGTYVWWRAQPQAETRR